MKFTFNFKKKYILFLVILGVAMAGFVIAQTSITSTPFSSTLRPWNYDDHLVWHNGSDVFVFVNNQQTSLQDLVDGTIVAWNYDHHKVRHNGSDVFVFVNNQQTSLQDLVNGTIVAWNYNHHKVWHNGSDVFVFFNNQQTSLQDLVDIGFFDTGECGNGICDESETFLTCEEDCELVIPEGIIQTFTIPAGSEDAYEMQCGSGGRRECPGGRRGIVKDGEITGCCPEDAIAGPLQTRCYDATRLGIGDEDIDSINLQELNEIFSNVDNIEEYIVEAIPINESVYAQVGENIILNENILLGQGITYTITCNGQESEEGSSKPGEPIDFEGEDLIAATTRNHHGGCNGATSWQGDTWYGEGDISDTYSYYVSVVENEEGDNELIVRVRRSPGEYEEVCGENYQSGTLCGYYTSLGRRCTSLDTFYHPTTNPNPDCRWRCVDNSVLVTSCYTASGQCPAYVPDEYYYSRTASRPGMGCGIRGLPCSLGLQMGLDAFCPHMYVWPELTCDIEVAEEESS